MRNPGHERRCPLLFAGPSEQQWQREENPSWFHTSLYFGAVQTQNWCRPISEREDLWTQHLRCSRTSKPLVFAKQPVADTGDWPEMTRSDLNFVFSFWRIHSPSFLRWLYRDPRDLSPPSPTSAFKPAKIRCWERPPAASTAVVPLSVLPANLDTSFPGHHTVRGRTWDLPKISSRDSPHHPGPVSKTAPAWWTYRNPPAGPGKPFFFLSTSSWKAGEGKIWGGILFLDACLAAWVLIGNAGGMQKKCDPFTVAGRSLVQPDLL